MIELGTFLIFLLAAFGALTAPNVLEAIGQHGASATWWPVDFVAPQRMRAARDRR